jgi:uncharacterized protein with HEPN domain
MNIGHIGEQLDANKLSKEVQNQYQNIDWSNIKKFRDLAFHHYSKIKPKFVYDIYNKQIDKLIVDLQEIIDDLKKINSRK